MTGHNLENFTKNTLDASKEKCRHAIRNYLIQIHIMKNIFSKNITVRS